MNSSFRRKEQPEDEGWLITFADMSVLLMSFFILMFALSTTDAEQLKNITKALRDSGFYNETQPTVDATGTLKKELSLAVAQKGYDTFIAASDTKDGIDVELASSAFFAPGTAKFSSKAIPMLQLIAAEIVPLANQDITIEVVGHTDDTQPPPDQFPSNWELSAARASNVVRYLIAQKFPANKLRAVGLGDTQPKAPNRDAEGNPLLVNQAINRRVVIKLIRGDDR